MGMNNIPLAPTACFFYSNNVPTLSSTSKLNFMTRQLLAGMLLLAASCNAPETESTALPDNTSQVNVAAHDYGVTASYSTDFAVGDHKHGDLIVKLWKDFDANTFENGSAYFADSVMAIFPGYRALLSRDSMIAMAKLERDPMDSVRTSIDAIVPLKASNKNETVVAIWGEEHAYIKGKKQRRDIHEVWGVNENGKVTWMKQYTHAVAE
jgi:hypothetical protein